MCNNGIDLSGQPMIFVSHDIACIVRRQPDLHCIPDIGPQRVVVHFLRFHRHPGHKGKGFVEIFKLEFPVKLIVGFLPHNLEFELKNKMLLVPDLFIGQLHDQLYPIDKPDSLDDLLQRFIADLVALHQP